MFIKQSYILETMDKYIIFALIVSQVINLISIIFNGGFYLTLNLA
jgi:hypothetical protein